MATRRRRLHRAAADALMARPHPDPDAVAYHLQQAGDGRAVEWLVRAGERAQAAYAWPTAVARYESALAEMERRDTDAGERGWLLYRMAKLLGLTDGERALRYLHEAATIADAHWDRALAAAALFARGHVLMLRQPGSPPELRRRLDAALAAFDALSPEEVALIDRQVSVGSIAAMRGFALSASALVGQTDEAFAAAARAPVIDVPAGVDGDALGDTPWVAIASVGYMGLGEAYALCGRPASAREAFARSLALARAAGFAVDELVTLCWLLVDALLPYGADTPAARQRAMAEADATVGRTSGLAPGGARTAGLMRAHIDALEGRWEQAKAALQAILPTGFVLTLHARGVYGAIQRAQGVPEAAWEQVQQGMPDGPTSVPGTLYFKPATELLRLAAALCLDADGLAPAREWLEAHDRWLEWSGAVLGQAEGQTLWAQYHRQAGDRDAAREHAERALGHASAPRQPLALLAAHRLLGELDLDGHHTEEAQAHLDAALALAGACHTPYDRGLTLLALAELRAVQGETEEAYRLLDDVRSICIPIGARPALARAGALAARLAAVATAAHAYPAGLSAREVEVLRLVAEGMTNPEIAERLFLSRRTVEQHLRSVYNKLDVPSRAAAAAFAVQHGIAEFPQRPN
jgi:DNA-binding CsgD family transcriptional regulator